MLQLFVVVVFLWCAFKLVDSKLDKWSNLLTFFLRYYLSNKHLLLFFADQGIPSTQLHGCCDNGFASSSDWRTTLCATQKLGVPLQQDVLGNWSSGKHFVSFIFT